jgi:hypothetical protein
MLCDRLHDGLLPQQPFSASHLPSRKQMLWKLRPFSLRCRHLSSTSAWVCQGMVLPKGLLEQGQTGSTSCVDCLANQVAVSPGATTCVACTTGYYRVNAATQVWYAFTFSSDTLTIALFLECLSSWFSLQWVYSNCLYSWSRLPGTIAASHSLTQLDLSR